MTIHGKTMAEMLESIPAEPRKDQDVIRPWSNPLYKQGHLAILKGNLAPEGCVAKITGLKKISITGPARVFDSEPAVMKAILARKIRPGDVLVIRYEGPKGGPGMQEMLAPTSALIGQGLGDSVGLLTDGRFSGGTWGMVPSPSTRSSCCCSSMFRRRNLPRAGRSGARRSRATPAACSAST
jgi:dihydroxy-acid dehydratase